VEAADHAGGTWLCPTELDRARLIEMIKRGLPVVGIAVVVGSLITVPVVARIGPAMLAPFFVAMVVQVFFGILVKHHPHPEYWLLAGDVSGIAALVWATALTGGVESPLLSLFAWTLVMTGTRYSPRGTLVLIALCALGPVVAAATSVDRGDALLDLRLPSLVAALLGLGVMIVALSRAERQYREQSLLDPLTGLLNRLALERRFEELQLQAALSGADLCLVAADLDHFKSINDTHGHDVGDAVLRDVAYAMRTHTRSFSMLYRIGGEEFVALLPGLDSQQGAQVAERLRLSVEECRSGGIPVTMSFGVASAAGDDVEFASLFNAADTCLYEAKRQGRNRVIAAPSAVTPREHEARVALA
jgi:diguanylate cyclase (GGDEF)-like protein